MNRRFVRGDYPTVGILAGWSARESTVPDYYLTSILKGIQSAAQVKGCHFLIAWGVGRVTDSANVYPAWPEPAPDSDFVPVGPWNTDGLIVFTPLRSPHRSQYIQEQIEKGFPIVFIAPGEDGPTVSVDNEKGIRQALDHLIYHGHQQIAFIAGSPNDRGDSSQRLAAYRKILTEHDLEPDPRLIAYGSHTVPGGYLAMKEILSRGTAFSGLIASNDNSAVGAIQAIQEAGLRIPEDIALIGFDDQPNAMAQRPSLSTIHVPLSIIGEQALSMMLNHIHDDHPLENIHIPTRLVRRRSCGCLPAAISAVAERKAFARVDLAASNVNLQEAEARLIDQMLACLPAESRYPGEDPFRMACSALVDAFFTSLDKSEPVFFQEAIKPFLSNLEAIDDVIGVWQEMVTILRNQLFDIPMPWDREGITLLADDLLHQLRVAICDHAEWQAQYQKCQKEIKAKALTEFTLRLSSILDQDQAVDFLASHLESMGIHGSRVCIFEKDSEDPVSASLILNKDVDPNCPKRFPSRLFPPDRMYPSGELLNIALFPLVFQEEALGYAAFHTGDLETCAVIATQLAATIKTSQLHNQVIELSLTDPLTGLYNRRYFNLYLQKEVSRHHRFAREMAIILLDIDQFKRYNDLYGHPAGDDALQKLADCLSVGRRTSDVVARLGGDEFILILPETGLDGARTVMAKIRKALGGEVGLEQPITISAGIAALDKGADANTLVKQADIALYQAKHRGGSCEAIYDGGPDSNRSR